MSDPILQPSAELQALAETIEELVPDAGFWQKGKPIDFDLEDLLRATQRMKAILISNRSSHCWELSVWCDGYMVQDEINTMQRMGEAQWILSEPLSKQPPETIDFLLGLLRPTPPPITP